VASKDVLPAAGHKTVKVFPPHQSAPEQLARCVGAIRITCVIDGDTFWWKREKIRIENIDAPELTGMCAGEPMKAERAAERLTQLLGGRVELVRNGRDNYGRTLARVEVDGDDVGEQMVREGLARAWPDGPKAWC